MENVPLRPMVGPDLWHRDSGSAQKGPGHRLDTQAHITVRHRPLSVGARICPGKRVLEVQFYRPSYAWTRLPGTQAQGSTSGVLREPKVLCYPEKGPFWPRVRARFLPIVVRTCGHRAELPEQLHKSSHITATRTHCLPTKSQTLQKRKTQTGNHTSR